MNASPHTKKSSFDRAAGILMGISAAAFFGISLLILSDEYWDKLGSIARELMIIIPLLLSFAGLLIAYCKQKPLLVEICGILVALLLMINISIRFDDWDMPFVETIALYSVLMVLLTLWRPLLSFGLASAISLLSLLFSVMNTYPERSFLGLGDMVDSDAECSLYLSLLVLLIALIDYAAHSRWQRYRKLGLLSGIGWFGLCVFYLPLVHTIDSFDSFESFFAWLVIPLACASVALYLARLARERMEGRESSWYWRALLCFSPLWMSVYAVVVGDSFSSSSENMMMAFALGAFSMLLFYYAVLQGGHRFWAIMALIMLVAATGQLMFSLSWVAVVLVLVAEAILLCFVSRYALSVLAKARA